jgi:hypothetical protein
MAFGIPPTQSANCCVALALLLAALTPSTALGRTPTPTPVPTNTDGPSPTPTTTWRSPTPPGTPPLPHTVVILVAPDPARSGQRVTLDGSQNPSGTYRWSQVGGELAIQIEDADQPVAHFTVPALTVDSVVSVQLEVSVGPYDLRPQTAYVWLLPADWVLCGIGAEGIGSVPPGDALGVAVGLRPYGMAVTELQHEMGFTRFAPVVDRGGGVPDCEPAPDLSVLSADFAFVPDGCVQTDSCTGVRASLTTRYAIPDYATVYRCMVVLVDEPSSPEEGCHHPLTCVGGTATSAAGQPLILHCPQGSDELVSANYARRPLGFDFVAEPPEPNVGDTVRLTVTVHGEGGLARYQLRGAEPFLNGTLTIESAPLGTVTFDLQADCPGTAELFLALNYETLFGCPGNTSYGSFDQGSPAFLLTVRDPGTFRVSGRVADHPQGCEGGARVEVRLDPVGWVTTSNDNGEFAFDGVPPGDYMLSVPGGCGPFQCWLQQAVHVGAQDVALKLCPQRLAGDACIGDCDLDHVVRVEELIVGVAMALGRQAFAACPAIDADGDGAIAINEIVVAVNSALDGCPAVPPAGWTRSALVSGRGPPRLPLLSRSARR